MEIARIIGIFGAVLAGVAYLPQITHLVKEHCSAGISIKAFRIWLIAAIAVSIEAFSIRSPVFILLSFLQTGATATILLLCRKYKGTCPSHTPAAI